MDLRLPEVFREFLKSLNDHDVQYLLIGGYAVVWHGYARFTGGMDIWIAISPENANKAVAAVKEFGFDLPETAPELFQTPGAIIRMGVEPLRIEVVTRISGVDFAQCYAERVTASIEGIEVNIINLKHLRQNKAACGRNKDLDDLEHLPTL